MATAALTNNAITDCTLAGAAPVSEVLEDPPPPSPLLRIPAELRNRIYEKVLIHKVVKISPGSKSSPKTTKVPGLLQSCQQIREEALRLYYANNVFIIATTRRSPSDSARGLCRWIGGIGPIARKEVRKLCLAELYNTKPEAVRMLKWLRDELEGAGYELREGVLHVNLEKKPSEPTIWFNVPEGMGS